MNKKVLSDAKARERIGTEFTTNFFVEAGAGSGKTHSLVDRMTGLIRYGYARIEDIAAVTFTRKAAAELRERFQVTLEAILHEEGVSEREKDNILEALSNFERASISTIHSFCAKLLRERPVEAGIDPGFKEIEEEDDFIYARLVWADYVDKQGLENGTVIAWMQEHGINPSLLDKIYMQLVTYPDVKILREYLPKPDFSHAKEGVKKEVHTIMKKMPKEEPGNGWDKLQTTIRRCLKLFGLGYLEDDRLFVNLLKILNTKQEVTQRKWIDRNTALACLDVMTKLQLDVIVSMLLQWSKYLHKPLMDFALGGVDYYDKWRRDRSVLNFQDLLMRTANLLKGNKEVRTYFKKYITHLLVDEFQDTDPIQAEIVMLLTAEDSSESDWRKAKPKPGSLFLVGDPKQSIYRFRRADIDIYNQVKEIFKKGAGETLELTTNFRSLDSIRDMTNTVFNDIFPVTDTKYQAKFTPLMTIREKNDQYTNGIFENRIPKVTYNKADIAAQLDAGIIASWIYESINGRLKLERTDKEKKIGIGTNARPGDFMIITKQKKRLPVYAKALESLGIPYEISGGENFNNSEEIYEIYKILHAIADPKNQVALVGALRGIYFGISDEDLYKFAKSGGRFSFFYEPKEQHDKIKNAFVRLKTFYDISIKKTPVTAIEMIVERLGAIPLAISEDMGSSRAGNLFKVIELLRGKKPDNTGSFVELMEYLGELREKAKIEEMGLFPSTTRAVRIMNLHKAKGLEAPVVILADPASGVGDFPPELHIVRTKNDSVGYFTVVVQTSLYRHEPLAIPANWQGCAEEEARYDSAERARLDYVAVTRAKNILVVSTYREGRIPKIWESLYLYLDKMPKLKINKIIDPKRREPLRVSEMDWKNQKRRMETNISSVCVKSYDVTSVTDMIEALPISEGKPSTGASWGTVVHKALEYCGRGKRDKLEILAKKLLDEESLSHGEIPRLIKTVDAVMESGIWKRMAKAKEKYFEIPFSVMKDNTIISGIMDLVFKEDDGWVVIDYKTDDFDVDLKKKSIYEQQIEIYSNFWEKITGENIKEKLLYKI